MKKRLPIIILILIIAGLFLIDCAMPRPIGREEITKMTIIMPGSMTDHDFNELATSTGSYLHEGYGFPVEYFDQISVPSLPGKLDDVIKGGSDLIWLHGSQYDSTAYKVAESHQNVNFIVEADVPPESTPQNVWVLDRNYAKGMYVIGRLAAEKSQTGKIAYISGLNLPFTYAEIHAIQQAILDSGKQIEFTPVWVGDFNDPELARIATQEQMDKGVDVMIGSLNYGTTGIIAALESSGEQIWFTSKYTDKSSMAPEHYLTSFLFNFNIPLEAIIQDIRSGKRSGFYQMDFNKGLLVQDPIQNVDSTTIEKIRDVVNKVRAGEISVEKNFLPIGIPSEQ